MNGETAPPADHGGTAAPDDEAVALAHTLFDAAREGNSALLGGTWPPVPPPR